MSLEVIDFTVRKKTYKIEAGEFNLKPPYMYVINQAKPLMDKLVELAKEETNDNEIKDLKKLADIQLKILKLILEETDKGKLENLTLEFPMPMSKTSKKQNDEIPERHQIYKNLYILFKGDLQKMDWFYKNKTEADLMLMIYINTLTGNYE